MTTVLWCDLLVEGTGRLPGCGLVGVYRDTTERRVTDVPVVGHPLELRVRVPRYRCTREGWVREVFAHDTSRWAHTRHADGQGYVTVIVDLTDVMAGQGRLGCSTSWPGAPRPR